jgi:hypothetical protein
MGYGWDRNKGPLGYLAVNVRHGSLNLGGWPAGVVNHGDQADTDPDQAKHRHKQNDGKGGPGNGRTDT